MEGVATKILGRATLSSLITFLVDLTDIHYKATDLF